MNTIIIKNKNINKNNNKMILLLSLSLLLSLLLIIILYRLYYILYDLNIRRIFFINDYLINLFSISFYKLLRFVNEPINYNQFPVFL